MLNSRSIRVKKELFPIIYMYIVSDREMTEEINLFHLNAFLIFASGIVPDISS